MSFVCNGPNHEGDRCLPLSLKGHGRKCKKCKALDSKKAHKQKQSDLLESRKCRFKTAEDWNKWNRDQYEAKEGKHRHVVPKEEEFEARDEFLKACRMEQERQVNGGDGRDSLRNYMDRDNKRKRETYASDKLTEEGMQKIKKKRDADDRNDRLREEEAIRNGKDFCRWGNHVVDKQDMIFCPVEDLNLYDCRAGRVRHHACMLHYEKFTSCNRERIRDPVMEKLYEYHKSETKRGLKWNLDDTEALKMLRAENCYYCDRPNEDGTPLGIDRKDFRPTSYDPGNTVPCCSSCNYAKGGMSESEFVQQCSAIHLFQEQGIPNKQYLPYRLDVRTLADAPSVHTTESSWNSESVEFYNIGETRWKRRFVLYQKAKGYSCSKYDAERKRDKEFHLTPLAFDSIVRSPCVHCGYFSETRIGVDRINNDEHYALSNCQPSCTTCNFFRRNMSNSSFYTMVRGVFRRHVLIGPFFQKTSLDTNDLTEEKKSQTQQETKK